MPVFKEIPPTAGFSLSLHDYSLPKQAGSLEEDFKTYLGVAFARITYSGTAALYLILQALKECSSKRGVIIPSFVCPLVALAIHRAGFRVVVCDIQQDSFDFDRKVLEIICAEDLDIVAIVTVHLGGIPVDLKRITEIAKRHAILIIEDCAQALGAEYNGRKVGTWGDLSFFSLCRGKGLTIFEGGVIATHTHCYAAIVVQKINQLVRQDPFSEAIKIMELFGYGAFYRPQLFWWVYRLPQLFWSSQGNIVKALGEDFSCSFPIHNVSDIRKAIGHANFHRLQEEIAKQRQKAHYYIEGLKGISGITCITETASMRATYPYLTLFFDDAQKRNTALQKLRKLGLGASQIYAYAITDYEYLEGIVPESDCPCARSFAQRHITLSTNSFLCEKDMQTITAILKSA
jgi:dTDP-4-amino-4,6-dideoxygalactose transaminase